MIRLLLRLGPGCVLLGCAGVRLSANVPAPEPEPAPHGVTAVSPSPNPPAVQAPAPEAASPAAKAAGHGQEKAKTRAPDEFHGLLNLGASLAERGDYDAAEIAYRQVFTSPEAPLPEVKTALLGLARMHRRQGSLTKAAAIYERYLKEFPSDDRTPDALLELGRTLRAMGIYKTAIARFYSVLNATLKLPGDGFERYQILAKTAQFEVAQTHFEAGEYQEAARFYTRLRRLDLAPADRARAHFMSAFAQRLHGDLDGAVTTLRGFIEESPEDENIPEARYLLAVSLRELKRPQEALVVTLELLRTEKSRVAQDPKRWAYWQRRTGNQLANDLFENGETMNAQAVYTSLVELSPEPAWRLPLTYQIGLCAERLGTLERAREAYQTIVKAAPAADLAELARMAAWRLEHLSWREGVDQQITSFFTTSTGTVVSPPPVSNPVATP